MLMNRDTDDAGQLRELLVTHVPEVASGVVEIRGIARKVGTRSLVIVDARDPAVDAVGAVVGRRGCRIKPVVAELGYEMVDVVRWSDSLDQLIGNLIAPNRALEIHFEEPARQATITILPDQRDAALLDPIRLALASHLVGWKLNINSRPPSG
jgi:N utilization substance protein A